MENLDPLVLGSLGTGEKNFRPFGSARRRVRKGSGVDGERLTSSNSSTSQYSAVPGTWPMTALLGLNTERQRRLVRQPHSTHSGLLQVLSTGESLPVTSLRNADGVKKKIIIKE